MSYEGFDEYLCENGHYSINQDIYDYFFDEDSNNTGSVKISACTFCEGRMKYSHAVDQTNGIEEDNPHTYPAKKLEIGFDDNWKKDHYGNNYAVKVMKYKPPYKDSNWTELRWNTWDVT